MKKKENLKGTLAFAFITILCLSMSSVYTLKVNAQQSSGIGNTTLTPSLLWKFTPHWSNLISPFVADGHVYFISNEYNEANTTLYCLDAYTGTQIWNYNGSDISFTVANGCIYVGELSNVVCLNAANGVEIWNFSYETEFATPVVDGGIVYVGSYGGSLYAFNASTGAQIWIYTGPKETHFGSSSLAVIAGYVYAISNIETETGNSMFGSYSSVYAIRASTGKELWNYTTQGWFNSLIAAGNNVYISCWYYNATDLLNNVGVYDAGGVLAFEAQNGQLIWNYTAPSFVVSSFAFAGGTVYLTSRSGSLYALGASDGTVIWNYTAGLGLGSPLPVNGYLYVGSSAGVYCFDAFNGKVIWNFVASDFADSSATDPTFANGVIYVGWNGPQFFLPITQHNFYALDGLSGTKLWNNTLGYTVASYPVVVNSIVYIAANSVTGSPDFPRNGAVLALNSTSEKATTSSPLPTVPEFPVLILLPLSLAFLSIAVVLRYRKNR
jgi:outer membrane protein assembly factor BamB